MKNKLIIGLMITAISNQVFALGVTKLFETTGESLFESAKSVVKSEVTKTSANTTKNTDSKSMVESSQESATGSVDSTTTSGKTSKEASRESSEDTTKNSPKTSTETAHNSVVSTGDTTQWLVCANRCKQLLDEPALVPAAEKYLQGEAISLTDAGKLQQFLRAMKQDNPELAQEPGFKEAALISLANGEL